MPRPPSPEITGVEKQVFDFIRSYWEENGISPSLRDISEHLNNYSTSLSGYYVRRLAERGLIKFKPRVARSIVVVQ